MEPSKGLGDSVEKLTRTTGIKSLVQIASKAMGVRDCGCDERKAFLNKLVPYKRIKK